eukprot:scaffold93311_cov31-Tisochrysis_lutea.AAC.1
MILHRIVVLSQEDCAHTRSAQPPECIRGTTAKADPASSTADGELVRRDCAPTSVAGGVAAASAVPFTRSFLRLRWRALV